LSLNNLGLLYYSMGEYAKAEPLYREALGITKASLGEEHPDYARGLNNLGLLYYSMGEYAKAEPLYREALAIRKAALGEKHPDYAMSLNTLGLLYYSMGEYAKAEPLHREAVEIVAGAGVPQSESLCRLDRAKCLRLMGRTGESLGEFEEGTRLFEEVRGRIGEGERRGSFQAAHRDYYGNYAAALAAAGKPDEAFETLERGRAKSLLDLLGTQEVRGRGESVGKPAEVARLEAELLRLRGESSQVAQAPGPAGEKTRGRRDALAARATQLEGRRLALIDEIRQADPEQGSLLAVDPPGLAEIQSLLGASVTLVGYWHAGELKHPGNTTRDELWAFVVTGSGCTLTTVAVTRAALKAALDDYAALLADASVGRDGVTSASAGLHALLVEPVAAQLGAGAVVVVPWGPMFKVPFASLAPAGGEPLGARKEIVVTPAAGLYRYIAKKRASGRSSIFALGNPVTALSPLPGAEREAAEVGALFSRSTVRTRAQATESLLRSRFVSGGVPDVVHLACHGIFNDSAPQLSHLALTPEGGDDGRLEMHEVYGLDWRGVSLVTLSACSSGKAKLGGGNDIVGLVRGFFFAGAPSVLCSLWDVDDEATRALMVEFYRQYLGGKSKPEALRLAQTAIRTNPQHPEWAHPYYWAAFVLFGDWM
jgi:CHAT domain-containing protein/tetratricopeptide (TPR) repeat protein